MATSIKERLNLLLYGNKTAVLVAIKIISVFNAIAAIGLIAYDIGFHHSKEKMDSIHAGMDVIFGVFAVTF